MLGAALIITEPQSVHIWTQLDELLSPALQSNVYTITDQLLIGYAFHLAYTKFKDHSSPFTVLKITHQHVIEALKSRDPLLFDIPTEELVVHQSIDEKLTFHSLTLERLSLCLRLLALPSSATQLKAIHQNIVDYLSYTLHTITKPIKLSTLKSIWQNLSNLQLEYSYIAKRKLYELVHASIEHESLQLCNREEEVLSLLESMITLNFKHKMVIDAVFQHFNYMGIHSYRHWVRIFNLLLELSESNYYSML